MVETDYYLNPKYEDLLIGAMHDEYSQVSYAAAFGWRWHRKEATKHIPEFQKMLKDPNPGTRAAALQVLSDLQVPIPREDLEPFFRVPDLRAVWTACLQLRGEGLTGEEIINMLDNREPSVREVGLQFLRQNADKQSVELALPLLKDPEKQVQFWAALTLRVLTGQHFTEDQADQWVKWWTENKTNFVVELHPEELRPRIPYSRPDGIGDRPLPRVPPQDVPR